MSKKEFSLSFRKKKYDEIYKEYNDLLKEYNPCNIHIKENILTCNGVSSLNNDGLLCCGGCKHLSKKGCRVKALSCKIWLCQESIEILCKKLSKKHIIYFFGMREWLHQQSRIFDIPYSCRNSKRQNFKNE